MPAWSRRGVEASSLRHGRAATGSGTGVGPADDPVDQPVLAGLLGRQHPPGRQVSLYAVARLPGDLGQTANHQEVDSLTTTFADPVCQQNLINQVPAAYRSDSAGIWRETDRFLGSGGVLPVPGTTPHPPWETTTGMEIGRSARAAA
jgi:hypothetical protein